MMYTWFTRFRATLPYTMWMHGVMLIFLGDYADAMGIKSDVLTDTVAEISNFIKNKDHNDVDPILFYVN